MFFSQNKISQIKKIQFIMSVYAQRITLHTRAQHTHTHTHTH